MGGDSNSDSTYDLAVTKTLDAGQVVCAGDSSNTQYFDIMVTNEGGATPLGWQVNDYIVDAGGLLIQSSTLTVYDNDSCDPLDNQNGTGWSFSNGTAFIASGTGLLFNETAQIGNTFTFTVGVDGLPAGDYTNIAYISSDGGSDIDSDPDVYLNDDALSDGIADDDEISVEFTVTN